MRYLLVDTANTFFRARHVIRGSLEDKVGMSLATVLGSVRKAWRDFKGDHVIFFLEGRSWRKDYYEPYKKNRAVARAAHTEKDAPATLQIMDKCVNCCGFKRVAAH